MTLGLYQFHCCALSLTRLRREPSALVASTACFPLWLKICHRHIFLTRRAHPEGAYVRARASLGVWALPYARVACNALILKAKLAIKQNDKYNFVRQDMFDITVNDVLNVYKQLKDSYPLVLTTTSALNAELDAGFTIDCPIIVAKAHGQIIWLYECDDIFVMDVTDEEQTKGTHWHPYNVEYAVHDIEDFINGKSNYDLQPFRQA